MRITLITMPVVAVNCPSISLTQVQAATQPVDATHQRHEEQVRVVVARRTVARHQRDREQDRGAEDRDRTEPARGRCIPVDRHRGREVGRSGIQGGAI